MALQDKLAALVVSVAGDVKALLMALANKQDKLNNGTSIKTINGESVLGAGDLVIEGGGGGAGLTLFEESRSVASPNATVPVHALTALGAETNIDFVISPKGAGAFSLQVPDNTTAGGNKRGAGAVDLQTSRNSAIQVASGANSLVSGRQCRATGGESVAVGAFCVATQGSAIAMGSSATASGQNGSVALGRYADSLGNGSAAIGSYVTASGDLSLATGGNTTTRGVAGAVSEGVSQFGAQGQTQAERILQRFDTPGVTPTQLVSGQYTVAPTAANSATMPNNSAYYCRLRVLARNTATNESMSWSGTALIKRGANAASTTLIGSTIASDFGDAAMSACTVTLSADTTRGALAVIVTGLASTSIRWVAQLETVEAA